MSLNWLIFMLHHYSSVFPLFYDGVSILIAVRRVQLKTVCGIAVAV